MRDLLLPVYIKNFSHNSVGGPQSFLKNMSSYLRRNGLDTVSTPSEAKIIFFSVSYPVWELVKSKLAGKIIVQRLDGLHYFERNGRFFWWKNKKAFLIYKFFADHIIFQTEYAKKQVKHLIGEFSGKSSAIIPNGADFDIYFPSQNPKAFHGEWIFVTSGAFRHLDMIRPILRALDKLPDNIKFKLLIAGPIENDFVQQELSRPYVEVLASKAPQELAEVLRDSHAYLYSALNSVCPNALIEAISCGLPVVAFESGGVGELCAEDKSLLVKTPNKIIHVENDFDIISFSRRVEDVINDYSTHQERARALACRWPLEVMGERYLRFFQSLIKMES